MISLKCDMLNKNVLVNRTFWLFSIKEKKKKRKKNGRKMSEWDTKQITIGNVVSIINACYLINVMPLLYFITSNANSVRCSKGRDDIFRILRYIVALRRHIHIQCCSEILRWFPNLVVVLFHFQREWHSTNSSSDTT